MDDEPLRIPPLGIPPGVEPGESERAPVAIFYFRILAAFILLACTGFIVRGTIDMTRSIPVGGTLGSEAAVAALQIGFGLVFATPYLIVFFGGRRPWVHTLGTVALALPMFSLCCVPFTLPVLLTWVKPETRRYYCEPDVRG